jgi:DNA-binding XRE family transcriptional regulator
LDAARSGPKRQCEADAEPEHGNVSRLIAACWLRQRYPVTKEIGLWTSPVDQFTHAVAQGSTWFSTSMSGRGRQPSRSRKSGGWTITQPWEREFVPVEFEPIFPVQGGKSSPSNVGLNINKLRQECGWSFEAMADEVGISKDTALDHVNKGTRPQPKTLRAYADAFTDKFGRQVSVGELQGH